MNNQNDKINSIKEIADGLIWIGQLGFSLVAPPVVLGFAGFWLSNRFDFGTWTIWVLVAVGLLTSASTAAGYYKDYRKKSEKQEAENPRPIGFNDHL